MNTVFVDTSVLVAAEDTGQGALHAAVLQWLGPPWGPPPLPFFFFF